jgi:hypothetical protein
MFTAPFFGGLFVKLGRGHTSKNGEVISLLLCIAIGLVVMAGGYLGFFTS